jgi:dihydrofolate synthase/folylpolyglutamate synthase
MPSGILSYQEAVDYLSALSPFGIKLGLDTIRALCEFLGEPQKSFPSVLVAGTNGKGSVCAYLGAILQHSGYKTGVYTSPHLVDIRERIRIGDQLIPEDRFAFFMNEMRRTTEDLFNRKKIGQFPTYFEFITAIAFLWFKEEKIDIGVMEIGLGGRFDAVNIIDPILSVITEIDYDHQKHLGGTLTSIAGEKAGIMRGGGPVIISVSKKRPRDVLKSFAVEKKAVFFEALKDIFIKVTEIPSAGAKTSCGTPINPVRKRMEEQIDLIDIVSPKNEYKGLIPALSGRHQFGNIAAAVYASEKLNEAGFNIETGDIIFGIENARWEGRLEWVNWKIPLLLDGGHNPSGLRSLTGYIKAKLASKRFALIFACKTSKDYKKMCEILFPLAHRIYLPKIEGYQFVEPVLLRDSASKLNRESLITNNLDNAFIKAGAETDADFILAAGSLHLVGEVINYLNN